MRSGSAWSHWLRPDVSAIRRKPSSASPPGANPSRREWLRGYRVCAAYGLPMEGAFPQKRFGSASAVHKRFLEREKAFFQGAMACGAGRVQRDGRQRLALAKHRWGDDEAPPDSGASRSESYGSRENESKRHLLADGRGVPLSLIVTGSNRHDCDATGDGA